MNAIIISISSDIGIAMAKDWSSRGWNLFGTYRTASPALDEIPSARLVFCDLLDLSSVESASALLNNLCPQWDVLVLAPGNLEPIGDFKDVDFDAWENGIQINLLRQLRLLHRLLPTRNSKRTPAVLFFAGGGTNNAVLHYSSYTLSKIALTKMCELLDAEIPDTKFFIVGPGCVKTKIHEPTLRLGSKAAGQNYQKTVDRLRNNDCTPMGKVVACCTQLVTHPSKGIGGRNFSVASDPWDADSLIKELENDSNMYKLRRHKNSWVPQ